MKNIQPITALRNTADLEADLKETGGPIFITKNGYSHLVILSPENYEALVSRGNPYSSIQTPFVMKSEDIDEASSSQSDPLGFVRVAASSITTSVCGVKENEEEIKKSVLEAIAKGVKVLVFSELTLTGYTCGDMFFAKTLQDETVSSLLSLRDWSKGKDILFVVGAPLAKGNSLYNCAVVIHQGKILGVVPKMNIPNYCEFYEKRHFAKGEKELSGIRIGDREYPFGSRQIFVDSSYQDLAIGIEICEDLWVPDTPSTDLAMAGANVILNLSASNEVVGKHEYRRNLVSMASARLQAAYVYCDAGDGESTTDLVFSSNNIIAENGKILDETPLFEMKMAIADIDLEKIVAERRKTTSFRYEPKLAKRTSFYMPLELPKKVMRHYARNPFIPEKEGIDLDRVSLVIKMQSMGLVKRLLTVRQKKAFVGLSGGLDSTLALLVTVEAFKHLGYDLSGITAITLPAFGTSARTHDNAVKLSKELGVSFEEINIKESVLKHFEDISHDPNVRNVTYENAQARARTYILMDIANDRGGLMVGTGDLSELCLGWTTFSGDHMSMYGVNASIPKTLVRYLVEGYASLFPFCADSLLDIVNTPISPELLPTDKKGEIAQKTEDKIGPYELHDFFIYHFLRFGFRPKKIFFIARTAYEGFYDEATIKKWMRLFFSRFFQSEFKRSCLPDGAKIGTVAISPRGDLRMPSDATVSSFLREIDEL